MSRYVWELHEGGKRRAMDSKRFGRIYELLSGFDELSHEQKTQLIIDDSPWLIEYLVQRELKDHEIIRELSAHIEENEK